MLKKQEQIRLQIVFPDKKTRERVRLKLRLMAVQDNIGIHALVENLIDSEIKRRGSK